ncbi:hypothetical protein [Paucibacter soli]|uniref:hypothetical protein n=1 Tax=Paucibacter soli TaxID=3133433 RepID=UPI0030B6F895
MGTNVSPSEVVAPFRSHRIDEWAVVYDAPTSQPGRLALSSSVFRGMRDKDAAIAYADFLAAKFKELKAPHSVFVVAGPTSTTKSPFEVVTASGGYSIIHRTQPPSGALLRGILRGATRSTRLVGDVQDPVARDILDSQYLGGLENELQRLDLGELEKFQIIGAGASSVVLGSGSKVIRLGLGDLPRRDKLDEVLQAEYVGKIGDLRYEVLPLVVVVGITPMHVEALAHSLAMRGYEWGDQGADNVGLLDGRPVIFDSDSVRPTAANRETALARSEAPGGAVISELAQENVSDKALFDAMFAAEELHGELELPGVIADVVAVRGGSSAIYGWTGDGTGRTRAALQALKEYGNGVLEVHDPGEPDSSSFDYWAKMLQEGLVTSLFDALGDRITVSNSLADSSASTKKRGPRT